MPKTVLFYRNFRMFTGGHLKVWDYFNHVRSDVGHAAVIAFSEASNWDETNPWLHGKADVLPRWNAANADVLFVAGMDWLVLDEDRRQRPTVPVINLIQGVKHAEPGDKRHRFLKYKAIRICVSEQIGDALRSSGEVNGPVFVIPNGIDRSELPTPRAQADRDIDLLIVGLKRRALATELMRDFRNRLKPRQTVEVLKSKLPRSDFLALLNRSKAAVFLPLEAEGFYLPALEAMALGTLVVCPDCVGNRNFCIDDQNCLRPNYTPGAILESGLQATRLSPSKSESLLKDAFETATGHALSVERQKFLAILNDLPNIW